MHKSLQKIILKFLALTTIALPAYAACSSPSGVAGQMGYGVSTAGFYSYCDGTSWVDMPVGTSGTGCSVAGQMYYDSAADKMLFCNGTSLFWINSPGSGSSGCTSPTAVEGALNYNTTSNKYQVCAGSSWIDSPY